MDLIRLEIRGNGLIIITLDLRIPCFQPITYNELAKTTRAVPLQIYFSKRIKLLIFDPINKGTIKVAKNRATKNNVLKEM